MPIHQDDALTTTRQIGTGLAFIVFPLVFVFAFASHPGLLQPRLLSPPELIMRVRGAGLLHLGHALVTINTALLVVAALHFMKRLERSAAAWAGFVGATLAVLGALALAADKGALCLKRDVLDRCLADRRSGRCGDRQPRGVRVAGDGACSLWCSVASGCAPVTESS